LISDEAELLWDFERLIDKTCAGLTHGTRLVLVMDEVEELAAFSGIFGFLKSISQSFDGLVLVFASYEALSQIATQGPPSFFTMFKEIRLGGMESDAEVLKLLQIRAQRELRDLSGGGEGKEAEEAAAGGASLALGEGVLERLRRVTGFNPFYLQEVYSYVLAVLREEERSEMQERDCEEAEEALHRDIFMRTHLRGLWDRMEDSVRRVLWSIAGAHEAERTRKGIEEFLIEAKIDPEAIASALDRALQLGLIIHEGAHYSFSSGIVERWCRENG
jgi:hypothetical protein